jgi:outer membrane lipoprotein SlyB
MRRKTPSGVAATKSVAVDALFSAAAAVVDGERSTGRLASEAAAGAGKSCASAALHAGLHAGVKKVAPSVARQLAKKTAARAAVQAGMERCVRNALSAVAFLVVDQAVDSARLATGSIDREDYRKRSVENVGGAAGSVGGTAVGAAIGTAICPGAGTAVGAFLGGLFGGGAGSAVARGLASRASVRRWRAGRLHVARIR